MTSFRWTIFGTEQTAEVPFSIRRTVLNRIDLPLGAEIPISPEVAFGLRDAKASVDVSSNRDEVFLNDVPVSGTRQLHHGDVLRMGSVHCVVSAFNEVALNEVRVAPIEEFESRLSDEVKRGSNKKSTALVGVGAGMFNPLAQRALLRRLDDVVTSFNLVPCWGQVAPGFYAGMIADVEVSVWPTQLSALKQAAGGRAKVTAAVFPDQAQSVNRLWECVDPILTGTESSADPYQIVNDPVMVRLLENLENYANRKQKVVLFGAAGVGKKYLAQWLAPKVDVQCVTTESWSQAASLGTAIRVPSLWERPSEIPEFADFFLSGIRTALGRPKLSLDAEAKQAFAQYRWPGNLREMRVILARAARLAARDEIGLESLPSTLGSVAPKKQWKSSMKTLERGVILDALARTQWNVSAAATLLTIPRRTLVYRMKTLGLRRPAR